MWDGDGSPRRNRTNYVLPATVGTRLAPTAGRAARSQRRRTPALCYGAARRTHSTSWVKPSRTAQNQPYIYIHTYIYVCVRASSSDCTFARAARIRVSHTEPPRAESSGSQEPEQGLIGSSSSSTPRSPVGLGELGAESIPLRAAKRRVGGGGEGHTAEQGAQFIWIGLFWLVVGVFLMFFLFFKLMIWKGRVVNIPLIAFTGN